MYTKELEFLQANVKKVFASKISHDFLVKEKTQFDLVTNLDIEIENELISIIEKEFPDDSILSEEINSTKSLTKRTWIIDPIDGTVNFSNGIPLYGIQCAFCENGEAVVSYLYFPLKETEYYAVKGMGAFENGKRLVCNHSKNLDKAIISMGDFSHKNEEHYKFQLSFVSYFSKIISKIRMFGSAMIDFTFAASSKTDGCLLVSNNLWDLLPGVLLCKEAGLFVKNLNCEDYKVGDGSVFVTDNENLVKEFSNFISKKK